MSTVEQKASIQACALSAEQNVLLLQDIKSFFSSTYENN